MAKLSRVELMDGFKESVKYKRNCVVVMDSLKENIASLSEVYLIAVASGVPHVEESLHMRALRDNESKITPFVSLCKVEENAGVAVEERYILLNKAKAKAKAGIKEMAGARLYHEMLGEWFINKCVGYHRIDKSIPGNEYEYLEMVASSIEDRYVEMINAYGNEIGTLLITLKPRGLAEDGGDEWARAAIDLLAERLNAFRIG